MLQSCLLYTSAEDALPDLGTGNIVKYLLTDAVSDKRILTFSGKGIGQDIITVDDQFCVRYAGDGCLQLMESDVNFAESIQLVPGNICQQSTDVYKRQAVYSAMILQM